MGRLTHVPVVVASDVGSAAGASILFDVLVELADALVKTSAPSDERIITKATAFRVNFD
jgi:hypothetical protein